MRTIITPSISYGVMINTPVLLTSFTWKSTSIAKSYFLLLHACYYKKKKMWKWTWSVALQEMSEEAFLTQQALRFLSRWRSPHSRWYSCPWRGPGRQQQVCTSPLPSRPQSGLVASERARRSSGTRQGRDKSGDKVQSPMSRLAAKCIAIAVQQVATE